MKIMSTLVLTFVLVLGATAVRAGDPVLAMLDPYFRIQTALSDDKTDGVKADALSSTSDLAAARAAFSALSDAVVAFSEKTKAAGDGVHTMFCPMANKQWMQKGEKVSNPYYGKSMLTCGEKKKST